MRPPGPDGVREVPPTRDDPLVGALSETVGGPVGDRAAAPARGRWRPGALGVLLALTAVCFALGLVAKTACVDQQWRTDVTTRDGEPDVTRWSLACASDVAAEYTGTGLVELAWPWSDDAATRARWPVTEQPAAVGLWTWAAARATHVLTGSPDVGDRYRQGTDALLDRPEVRRERVVFAAVNAVGLALAALLATWALARAHRGRPWDAAGFAVAPLLVLLAGTAWDLLAVAAVAGALAAWGRRRLVLAGALVGAGAAVGVWAALLLPALGLVAWRERRLGDVLPPAVVALASWAVLQAPAFLTGREQWEHAWSVAAGRGAESGTAWSVVAEVASLPGSAVEVSWVLLGLWCAGVAALAALAPAPPRPSQVALLLVAGVLLLRLSYEPAQALWLLPLAALARPRWRDLLVWQGAEVGHLLLWSWWRGGLLDPGGGGTAGFYLLGVGVHVAGTLWLVAVVARDVWVPRCDPVAALRVGPAQSRTTRSNQVAV